MEIPGLPNNTTGSLKQKKIITPFLAFTSRPFNFTKLLLDIGMACFQHQNIYCKIYLPFSCQKKDDTNNSGLISPIKNKFLKSILYMKVSSNACEL